MIDFLNILEIDSVIYSFPQYMIHSQLICVIASFLLLRLKLIKPSLCLELLIYLELIYNKLNGIEYILSKFLKLIVIMMLIIGIFNFIFLQSFLNNIFHDFPFHLQLPEVILIIALFVIRPF